MDVQSYEIFYSIFFYTISALLSVGVNVVFYLKARKSKLLSAFLTAQMIVIIWLMAKVLKKASPTDEMAWLWIVIQYGAVCFFGTVFLEFTYYYKKAKMMPGWIRGILYGFSLFNYLIVFTNDFHHYFFTSVSIFESHYGPWFYVHTAFSYIEIIAAYFFLINALVSNKSKVPAMQVTLFNLGLILPIVSNVVYIFNIIKFSFDITPIMYNLTIIIFGYSAYRYRFLDIKKVTRSMVLENLHEGIIIIDNNRRIVEQNNAIEEIVENHQKLKNLETIDEYIALISNKVKDFEPIVEGMRHCIDESEERYTTDLTMRVHGAWNIYILKLEKIKDHSGDTLGYVLRIIDITKHRELLQSLEEKNEALIKVNQQLSENISVTKQLVIAKERSRVSKEVHDILGHSVTIAISLLEISRQSLKKDASFVGEKITQAMEIIRGSLIELKKSMKNKKNDVIDSKTLDEELQKLIEDFEKSGVKVDYFYKDSDVRMSSEIYDSVYRICQEGLTNALRHGKAENVTIGIRYVDRSIDLFIIDDGVGCLEITKGNGLKGMENRVKELAGFFSYGSPDGDGFNVHVTLPIRN